MESGRRSAKVIMMCVSFIARLQFLSNVNAFLKVHFHPNMPFLCHDSEDICKSLISEFSADSDVAFVSLCMIYCIILFYKQLCWNLWSNLYKFGNYFTKQINLQEMFSTQKICTSRLLLVEKSQIFEMWLKR